LVASKKRLSFDVSDNRSRYCVTKTFTFSLQAKSDFPDGMKIFGSNAPLGDYVMVPTIYAADEGLREISSKK
jgi:hypothetical protein